MLKDSKDLKDPKDLPLITLQPQNLNLQLHPL